MSKQGKWSLLALTSIACATALPTQANDIEPTKEKYTAPAALTAITIDGKMTEWKGFNQIVDPKFAIPKGSGSTGTYVLFEEYAGGTWTGPDDQTSAVQVAYDSDNVYFGFVVTDDYHENAAHSAWNGDSVQLMIANGARTSQVALYNYALGGVEGATDDVVIMHEAGPGGDPACACETTAAITRDSAAKKTYYEIKLPKAALGLTELKPGVKFGLGMAINDGDEATPGQKGWGGLGAHSIVFGKTPGETAEVTLGPNTTTIEILGVGAEALLGGDLTDPENDGLDALGGATDPSWNWAGITASHEPDFEGGENSFNIFDNKVGGGNDKWCCDDPKPGAPVWVAVQFPNPVSLTHFTVTSGNDTPGRDPTNWQIQGSDDGTAYTPIFVFNNTVVPWTERNQVVKFTLPMPSVPFRYIRYIAYETPADLHQINEIEYFGTFGSSQLAYYSAVNPTITTFGFRLNDSGTSVVTPSTVKLTIDGTVVNIGTPTKNNGVIDVLYTPASQFLPNSAHTYSITAKDGVGNNITTSGSWTTAPYALLTAADKVTPDTTKPGFIFKVTQNESFQANDNTRPVQQLAGLLGENYVDPTVVGPAIGNGVPGANNKLPVTFEIPTVINMSQNGTDNAGNNTTDDVMPGIPGSTGSTDGIAADIITYVQLPAGKTTLIVNSDDGFRTTAGQINDVFKAQLAGEFVGGRGASDTVFTVYTTEAGVYPLRTIWYEGGGGANVEILSVAADGVTKTLLNDVGGLPSYRATKTPGPTAITQVIPPPGATGVNFDTSIQATIVDGATAVDTASVKLSLDGTVLNVAATKTGTTTTISFQPPNYLASGSVHSASISYTAGGVARTETWSFTVTSYATLGQAQQAKTVDKTKPGFLWRVWQNEGYQHTSVAQTEIALSGQAKDGSGVAYENLVDPTSVGPATGNGVKVGALYQFEIPTVINLSQGGTDNAGNWTTDDVMPGIPGTTGSTDGIDAEVITYADLPKGIITMGVNSDDGFKSQAGPIGKPEDGIFLGQFDGGRGASDTIFKFVVEVAGVYPIRTIWQEGGGGANIEIFTVKADGTKVLLNDSANGGYKSYRIGTPPDKVTEPPHITSITRNTDGSLTVVWTGGGTLQAAPAVTGPWADVPGATSPYKVSPTQAALFGRIRQ